MIWSPQQEVALQQVGRWIKTRATPYFTLAGFAGTGKTTLAKECAFGVEGTVYFASYTGKAAHVLRKTGIMNASTIHQLIYQPRTKCSQKLADLKAEREILHLKDPKPEADLARIEEAIQQEQINLNRPEFTLNTDSPLRGASLLVIDEYSMVDQQTGKDLLSFGCPILALGDPGQLPPVQGRQFFRAKPDILLTEIHRQAADNPIIRLSKDVREGRTLKPGTYGNSRVVHRSTIPDKVLGEMMLNTDQLLVGTNESRRAFNVFIRQMLGRMDPLPSAGDKLVCLRNNHLDNLLNGQTWTVTGVSGELMLRIKMTNDDGDKITCLAHPNHFHGTQNDIDHDTRREANEFDFGYALTVHKAQGSQWDHVVLIDEWRSANRKQWLYTGITRAAETVTIIQ